ncbi:MAG: hypothetical protein WAK03_09255 [Methylocystis sp.]|jgi:hypothetical protein
MPTNGAENWYCEHIVGGPWSFAILIIPLVGAYYYGRGKHKLGWILIGLWLPLQIGVSYVNNLVVDCPQLDAPISTEMQQ